MLTKMFINSVFLTRKVGKVCILHSPNCASYPNVLLNILGCRHNSYKANLKEARFRIRDNSKPHRITESGSAWDEFDTKPQQSPVTPAADFECNFEEYDNAEVKLIGQDSESVKPIHDIHQLASCLHPQLVEAAKLKGFDRLTPVQSWSIPSILSGRDLLARSQTGSGKTAAYLLPTLHQMLSSGAACGSSTTLVLAPTRELANQIGVECRSFASRLPPARKPSTCVVYGGASIHRQRSQLSIGKAENRDLLVAATPGRLIDLLERDWIRLDSCGRIILDEADRMLDMGFEEQIRKIMNACCHDNRQTLMFSATYPTEIQQLAFEFLNSNRLKLEIGRIGGVNARVRQTVEWTEREDKLGRLLSLLDECQGRVLVFVATKRSADFLERRLQRSGVKAGAIHGDKSQRMREFSLREFRSGTSPVLIATEVAARGLDIPLVGCVVNYDLPTNIDDYVHRIGRTGRLGRGGRAVAFFNEANRNVGRDLSRLLKEAGQEVPRFLLTGGSRAQGERRRTDRWTGRRRVDRWTNRRTDRRDRLDDRETDRQTDVDRQTDRYW